MSDDDDRGLDELERRLHAAFSGTRPRRGFADELWSRLEGRRPWWHRLRGPWLAALPAVAALALVLVGGLAVLRAGALSGSGAGGAGGRAAAPAGGGASAAGAPALPFGQLPAPAGALPDQHVQLGPATPGPGSARSDLNATAPTVPPSLPVYRYAPPGGPAPGTVLEPGSVPSGLASGLYPTRSAAEALAEVRAASRAAGTDVTVTAVRLVYVAVASGSAAYLEPAYEVTGTTGVGGTTTPMTVLVPALAASALR